MLQDYQGLLNRTCRKMNLREARAFEKTVTMDYQRQYEGEPGAKSYLQKAFPDEIMQTQLEAAGTKVSMNLIMFVLVTQVTSPQTAYLWAYTLNYIYCCLVGTGEYLTMRDFISAFPHGIPTIEAVLDAWNEQMLEEDDTQTPMLLNLGNWHELSGSEEDMGT